MQKALLMIGALLVCGLTAHTTYGQNYVKSQPTNKGFVCVATANGGDSCITINQLVNKQTATNSPPIFNVDSLPPAMSGISWGTAPAENLVQIASVGLVFSTNSSTPKRFHLDRPILKHAAEADPYLALALFNLENLQTAEPRQVGQIMFIPGELSTAWMVALIDSQKTFEEFYAQNPFPVKLDQYQTPLVYHYQITEFEDQSGIQLNISKAKTN
jgi:hypothetical protein